MKNFLQNWNYPKHAVAVSSLYLGVAIFGNALLGKKVPKDEKSLCPAVMCKQMTKKQWILNGVLAACYSFDMSGTYIILNKFKKQYK